jgi:GTP cyclohydrolase IA
MDKKKIVKGITMVLEAVGADLKKKDIAKTPLRVAQMYEEILQGEGKDASEELEVILEQKHDEIILLKDIPIYSLCEHHLLPFIGKAYVAYIPDKRITGLSKIARVVDVLAKRLQVQERLSTEIASVIMRKLKPKGVMVVIEAEHLCMTMRGVKKAGTITTTSVVRGVFRSNQKTRQEALSLMHSSRR